MRLICPAIIAPEKLRLKYLIGKSLSKDQRRNLVLICKVLQNLSNNIEFGNKEAFMIPLNEFIINYRPRMVSLLKNLAVSLFKQNIL